MNKVDFTPIGGQEFTADDLEFLVNGISEAIQGITSLHNSTATNYVLSGCIITENGANLDVSAGFVVINGEVCYVPAHSIVDTGAIFFNYIINETNDPAGSELLQDGGPAYEFYKIRRGVLNPLVSITNAVVLRFFGTFTYLSLTSIFMDVLGINTLNSTVALKADKIQDSWHYIGDPGQPVFVDYVNGNALKRRMAFKKDQFNRLYLKGDITRPSGSSSIIFVLPSGYIPVTARSFTCLIIDDSANHYVPAFVQITGLDGMANTGQVAVFPYDAPGELDTSTYDVDKVIINGYCDLDGD